MGSNDELRAALERRQAEDDAAARRRQDLDRQRQEFERDEGAIREQLYELVDRVVEALAQAGSPLEEFAVTPPPTGLWRLFERQEHAIGWTVSLNARDERVLCPDGTLITPQLRIEGRGPVRSTLRNDLRMMVDERLRRVRRATPFSVEIEEDYFAEAFGSGPFQGTDGRIEELRRRLSAAKTSATEDLADVLHQIGAPAI